MARARNRAMKITTIVATAPVERCLSAVAPEIALLGSFPASVGLELPGSRVSDPPEGLSEMLVGIAPAFATPDCDEGEGSFLPPEMVGVTPSPVTADGIARLLVVEELLVIPDGGVLPPESAPELRTTGGIGAGGPGSGALPLGRLTVGDGLGGGEVGVVFPGVLESFLWPFPFPSPPALERLLGSEGPKSLGNGGSRL